MRQVLEKLSWKDCNDKQFIYLFWIYLLVHGPSLRFPMLHKRKVTDSSQNYYNLALGRWGEVQSVSGSKIIATILRKDVSINHLVAYYFLVAIHKIKLKPMLLSSTSKTTYGNKSDAWLSQTTWRSTTKSDWQTFKQNTTKCCTWKVWTLEIRFWKK